ncbi:hypothetical protein UA39_15870, partial [Photobacterium angustum]
LNFSTSAHTDCMVKLLKNVDSILRIGQGCVFYSALNCSQEEILILNFLIDYPWLNQRFNRYSILLIQKV